MIERHGFTIVAVEADWPDAASIDRDVRGRAARPRAEPPFRRFPTWMWRNTDVDAFVGWLRAHNRALPPDRRAGFHGLDLYNLNGSIRAVIDYLDRVDPEAAQVARERYGCLAPFRSDPALRADGAHRRLCALQGGGGGDAHRPVRTQPRAGRGGR
jgi:erythromycin esterase-like protein